MQILRENLYFIKAINLNAVKFALNLKSPLNTTLKMRKCGKNLRLFKFKNKLLQNKVKR